MTFLELAKARYSVRKYKAQAIEEEKLSLILEAGRIAPTACNNQPQKVYVIKSEQAKKALAAVCCYTFDAPVILAICYDKDRVWNNPLMPGYTSGDVDASIVCTHMMLQAAELGLGSCWVGYFNADEVGKALAIPENLTVSALLPIGYPADGAKPTANHEKLRDFDDTIEEI